MLPQRGVCSFRRPKRTKRPRGAEKSFTARTAALRLSGRTRCAQTLPLRDAAALQPPRLLFSGRPPSGRKRRAKARSQHYLFATFRLPSLRRSRLTPGFAAGEERRRCSKSLSPRFGRRPKADDLPGVFAPKPNTNLEEVALSPNKRATYSRLTYMGRHIPQTTRRPCGLLVSLGLSKLRLFEATPAAEARSGGEIGGANYGG